MPRTSNYNPKNNHEDALLLAVLRSLSTQTDPPAFQSLSSEFDWGFFFDRVDFHRIGPLVYDALHTHWGAKTHVVILERLKAAKQQHTMQSLSQKAVMAQIYDGLTEANIPFLLMKGDAISERYYPEASRRIAIDIDILTAQHDFKTARGFFHENGFIQTTPDCDIPVSLASISQMFHADYAFQHKTLRVTVELHHRFAKNPYLFPVSFQRAISDHDILISNSRSMPVLNTPMQFIYGCTHGAKHDWFRLKWLCDIDFMIAVMSPADWVNVWAISMDLKLTKIIRETLSLHTAVFGDQSRYRITWKQPSSLVFYQDTMRRMQLIKNTQISDLGYLSRQIFNSFTRLPSWRYRLYNLFLMCADFNDVKRFKLQKPWWPIYIITGAAGRILRIIGRSLKIKTRE